LLFDHAGTSGRQGESSPVAAVGESLLVPAGAKVPLLSNLRGGQGWDQLAIPSRCCLGRLVVAGHFTIPDGNLAIQGNDACSKLAW